MDYNKEIDSLIDRINQLVKELMLRPDREVQAVVKRYIKKMNRLKNKIRDLKIRQFQDGGLNNR